MDAPNYAQRSKIVKGLNETPPSRHVIDLMRASKVTHQEHRLAVCEALEWAADELVADPAWAQAAKEAVALDEPENPQAVYRNLADADLLGAKTLRQAGERLLEIATDLLPPREVH